MLTLSPALKGCVVCVVITIGVAVDAAVIVNVLWGKSTPRIAEITVPGGFGAVCLPANIAVTKYAPVSRAAGRLTKKSPVPPPGHVNRNACSTNGMSDPYDTRGRDSQKKK